MKIKGMLVVEDDRLTRELVCDALESAGCYPVFDACNGEEALGFLSEHGARIEGMVLDLRMPRMCGDELLRELRSVHSGPLAVVLMSVHKTIEALVEENQDPRLQLDYLYKPFQVAGLLQKVESVLLRMRNAKETDPA